MSIRSNLLAFVVASVPVLALADGLGGSVVSGGGGGVDKSFDRGGNGQLGQVSAINQVIPLYVYPTSGGSQAPWTTLIGTTAGAYNSPLSFGRTRWIILSPDLTPTSPFESDWGTVITNAHDTTQAPVGTQVLAYIDMNFGSVTETTVEGEISKAASLYFGTPGSKLHLDGIFFDRAPGTQATYTGVTPAAYGTYLTDLLTYAAGTSFGSGAAYWMNPGFWPDEAVMNLGVPGVTTSFSVENVYATWAGTDIPDVPAWVAKYPSSRIASFVYSSSLTETTAGICIAKGINSLTSYFTDGSGGNPFAGLPSYWSPNELALVNAPPC